MGISSASRPAVYLLARAPSAYDSRLLRQAKYLAKRGCRVTVIATRSPDLPDREIRDGYVIERVRADPLHYKLLRWMRSASAAPRRQLRLANRLLYRRIVRAMRRARLIQRRGIARLRRGIARLRRGIARLRRVNRRVFRLAIRALRRAGRLVLGPAVRCLRAALLHFPSGSPERSKDARKRPTGDDQRPCHRSPPVGATIEVEGSVDEVLSGEPQHCGGQVRGRRARPSWGRKWITGLFSVTASAGLMVSVVLALLLFLIRATVLIARDILSLVFNLDRHLYSLVRAILLTWIFHRPLRLLDYTWRVYKVVKLSSADVIQAKDLLALPAAYVVSRLVGARLVYDSSELNLEAGATGLIRGPRKWLLHRYEGFMTRRSDVVMTVNDSIATILAQWYGIPKPYLVRNCPERVPHLNKSTYLRQRLNLPPDVPIVLYHGGLTANRGLHQLVESLQYLPQATLVLMGYGPLRAALERYADKLALSNRVAVIDAVPIDELIEVVASADIGVMPIQPTLLSYRLALPNKLFECLMAGLPVATSDFPEMSAIVLGHGVGQVFNPRDPADIARAVSAILEAPDYAEMRRRARHLALNVYCWECEAQEFGVAYQAILPGLSEESQGSIEAPAKPGDELNATPR